MATKQNTSKPKLLVKLLHQQNQLFILDSDVIKIGRGEEADLTLPNVSVSRIHAIIENRGGEYWIRDNESQNGFRVNQQAVSESRLKSGDEIQLGVFSLVFLGDRLEDNYYRGRSVSYLPKYDPNVFQANEDSTFVMSARDRNLLSRKTSTLYNGCVVMEDGRFFYPEDNLLSFGHKAAIVPVQGWYVFGVVAEITWNDKEHVLTKKSWLCPVKVNGKSVSSTFLRIGDKIQIGKTHFSYQMREGL